MEKENIITRIREFNRFYMPILNLLGNHYLGSECSATEARFLFEVNKNDGCNAKYIENIMNIDKSYLSRIIKKFENKGYLIRIISKKDLRSFDIHLTDKGKDKTEELSQMANMQIAEIIKNLNSKDYEKLNQAFDTITDILKGNI